jgi:hypothetical protein
MFQAHATAALGVVVSLTAMVWLVVAVAPSARAAEDCRSTDTTLREFELADLDPALQCQLGRVVNGHTTRGTIGPVQTPVAMELYEFLLDRPVITAATATSPRMTAMRAMRRCVWGTCSALLITVRPAEPAAAPLAVAKRCSCCVGGALRADLPRNPDRADGHHPKPRE